jgi:hypothetical protein
LRIPRCCNEHHDTRKTEGVTQDTEETVKTLEKFLGKTEEETRDKLTAGSTIAHEWKAVVYEGRKCLSDWGIFQVSEPRRPQPDVLQGRPDPGTLAVETVDWKSMCGFKWDVDNNLHREEVYLSRVNGNGTRTVRINTKV